MTDSDLARPVIEIKNFETEEDEPPLSVTDWVHEGKLYLKSQNHEVYDKVTEQLVGTWDPETNTICDASFSDSD